LTSVQVSSDLKYFSWTTMWTVSHYDDRRTLITK